jgi:hypothetical protein
MKRQPSAMDRVAKARPAELDPTPDPDRRLADLARALAEPSTFTASEAERSGPERARPPHTRLILGLSAAATVVAVATGLATNGFGLTRPPVTSSRETDLDASRILLVAADKVAADRATGRYWRTGTDTYSLDLAGPAKDPYVVRSIDRERGWIPRSGSGVSSVASKTLAPEPLTATDRAAWIRDGSPTTFTVRVPGRGKDVSVPRTATRWVVSTYLHDKTVFFVGHDISMSAIRALPADPARLRAFLMTDFKRNVEATEQYPLAGTWTQDSWLFDTASSLLTLPVSPEVRASAYRIMAGVKAVRSLGSVPDLTGRVGDAVAVQGSNALGQFERRIIIDPATGRMLADETRYLKPTQKLAWAKPTDVWQSTVITDIGWTNDRPPARTSPSGKSID